MLYLCTLYLYNVPVHCIYLSYLCSVGKAASCNWPSVLYLLYTLHFTLYIIQCT